MKPETRRSRVQRQEMNMTEQAPLNQGRKLMLGHSSLGLLPES
jgi:hypothetical protein